MKPMATMLVVVLGLGCRSLAVATAPERKAAPASAASKAAAVDAFWKMSRSGGDGLDAAISELAKAYFEHPGDAELARLLAGSHTWRLAEFGRHPEGDVGAMQASMFASGEYWADALALDPGHPLPEAFLGQDEMVRGVVFKDEKRLRDGFFTLKDAAKKWPAVDSFVLGLALTGAPKHDGKLDDAIDSLWTTVETVVGPVDRLEPQLSAQVARASGEGDGHFLFGSEKVPHAFEGLFSVLGDALVKKGDAALAKKVYAQAKLAPHYASWPFQAELEQQISSAEQRAREFPQGQTSREDEARLMPTLPRLCSTCHQTL